MPLGRCHRALLFSLALAVIAGCTAPPKRVPTTLPCERLLSAAERQLNVDSFDDVWAKVSTTYFKPERLGPGKGNVDWAAIRDELRPKLAAAPTMAAARAILTDMLGRLGETHFAIVPAELYDEKNDAASGAEGDVGITLRIVGPRAIVARIAPGSPAAMAGVGAGWSVVAVDKTKVEPMLAETQRSLEDASLPAVRLQHRAQALLAAPVGKTLRVMFVDGANRRHTVTLVAAKPDGEIARLGNLPATPLRTDARTLENGIGYFSLSIFLDPPRVMPMFDAFIRGHQTAPGIIIDLRGNPGGISGMANGMAGYFFEESGLMLGSMITRSGKIGFSINPRLPHYGGPVAVLVDGLSMSTSEIFARGMQDLGRAKIFGEPTPGAALPSTVIRLPNGDRFQFAVADYISTGGTRLEGLGVMPDGLVPLDRAALLAGHDAPLDAAIAWIRTKPPATRPAAIPTSAPTLHAPGR